MLQSQMPAWVSHSLSDPNQGEDDRYLASCALKVRTQFWWGRGFWGEAEAGGKMSREA